MGFAVYHSSKNWSPADFDTGTDRIAASLANIPRQIFEGIQVSKENELKNRAIADKEKQTRLEEERDLHAAEHQDKAEQRAINAQKFEEEKLSREDARFYESREDERALRRVSDEHMKRQDAVAAGHLRLLEAKFRLAEKEGNTEGLQVSLATELKSKKEAIDNFIATNKIFNDPGDEKMMRELAAKGIDPVKSIESIAQKKRGNLALFDNESLSVLSPMIEGANLASQSLWKVKYKQDDPVPLPTFFETLIRTKAYNSSVGDLNSKDPRVAEILEALGIAGTEDEYKYRAALSDNIHKRQPNTLIYDTTYYKKAARILDTFMRESKSRESKKETHAGGFLDDFNKSHLMFPHVKDIK